MDKRRLRQIERTYRRNLSLCDPNNAKRERALHVILAFFIILTFLFYSQGIRFNAAPLHIILIWGIFILAFLGGWFLIIIIANIYVEHLQYPRFYPYSWGALDFLKCEGYTEEEIEEFKELSVFPSHLIKE